MRYKILSLPLLALCACHHVNSDFGGLGLGSEVNPNVTGLARFRDVDGDAKAGPGDLVILSFDRSVSATIGVPSAIPLAAEGDSFGAGATVLDGPAATEIQIVLGVGAKLRSRGLGVGGATINQPSALQIEGGIVDSATGGLALTDSWLDIVPEPVPGDSTGLADTGLRADGGDFNLDGITDWVVAAGVDGLDLYQGLEAGGYLRTNLDTGGTFDVLPVDLLGQGRQDLVTRTDVGLQTYANQSEAGGALSYAVLQTIETAYAVIDLVVLDVEGDGDQDLVLLAEDGVRLVRNAGAGLFDEPEEPIEGSPTDGRSIVLADIAGDGNPDLLVARDGENVLIVNSGCGSFDSTLMVPGGGVTDRLVVGDLDGNGGLDVLGAGPDGIQAWRGVDGELALVDDFFAESFDPAALPVLALSLVDLDGDASLDVLVGGDDRVTLLTRDAADRLAPTGVDLPILGATDLVARDVDRDGDLDLMIDSQSGPRVWRGSLAGTWGSSRLRPSPQDVGAGPLFSTASADVDGDGFEDLILGRNSSVEIYKNTGSGSLAVDQIIDLGDSRAHNLAMADIDQDGDLDLVAAMIGDAPIVWLNDGDGEFIATQSLGFERATSVATGDLDGDGDIDVVLGRLESVPDRILWNAGPACDGKGEWPGFSSFTDLPGLVSTPAVVTGDVDADGDIDIIFGHGGDSSDRMFLNDGSGSFTLSPQGFGVRTTRTLSLADLDLDGDLDLFAGKVQEDAVWHNDGNGGFVLVAELGASSTYDADLVDLNGDGLLDLIEGRRLDQGIVVFMGTPDGLFSGGPRRKVVDDDVRKIQVIDIDRDGDPDFVTGMDDGDLNRLWLNQ